MRILIDGDACPNIKLIENTAKKFGIPVLIVTDTTHIIDSEYSEVLIVPKGKDSVDIYLINSVNKGDIVITQDYGLAVMVLGKKGHAINPSGLIYSDNNIDRLLLGRYINKKMRTSGLKVKGPKKRNKQDVVSLIQNLEKIIKNNI